MHRHPLARLAAVLTAAILGLVTALLTTSGPALAGPSGPSGPSGGPAKPCAGGKLSPGLAAAAQSKAPNSLAPQTSAQDTDPGDPIVTSAGNVVHIRVKKVDNATVTALRKAGATINDVSATNKKYNTITAAVPRPEPSAYPRTHGI